MVNAMRIIVFSDTHHDFTKAREIFMHNKEIVDLFIHCGDGVADFMALADEFPEKEFIFVRGNCDADTNAPSTAVTAFGGKKIFVTHGHLFDANSGTGGILQAAEDVDIILYGHTHLQKNEYVAGKYILNPGSLTKPFDPRPSYGVIDIMPEGIFPFIVEV